MNKFYDPANHFFSSDEENVSLTSEPKVGGGAVDSSSTGI